MGGFPRIRRCSDVHSPAVIGFGHGMQSAGKMHYCLLETLLRRLNRFGSLGADLKENGGRYDCEFLADICFVADIAALWRAVPSQRHNGSNQIKNLN